MLWGSTQVADRDIEPTTIKKSTSAIGTSHFRTLGWGCCLTPSSGHPSAWWRPASPTEVRHIQATPAPRSGQRVWPFPPPNREFGGKGGSCKDGQSTTTRGTSPKKKKGKKHSRIRLTLPHPPNQPDTTQRRWEMPPSDGQRRFLF